MRHYTEDGMQPPGCDVVGSIGPRWARRALALGLICGCPRSARIPALAAASATRMRTTLAP